MASRKKPDERNERLGKRRATTGTNLRQRSSSAFKDITSNFAALLHASQINTSYRITEEVQATWENYDVKVCTGNILRSSEALLTIIAELKERVTLNNIPVLNSEITERNNRARNVMQQVDEAVTELRQDFGEHLEEVEEELYTSVQ
eukprot:m.58363 g.58363  ORF g.58363 m.58363 type:complete len:147 (+) comp18996_c0_seq2:46-486(+)